MPPSRAESRLHWYTENVAPTDSTVDDIGAESIASVWASRIGLSVLACVVLAGATGLLGVHTSTVDATASGYNVTLDYPRTARAGLDVVWTATVEHEGGFDKDVTLAVTADYFDIYETQGFFPEPDSQTRDGTTLYLTFTRPPGDILRVSYDAYIQPSSQVGRDGTLAVVVDGERVADVDFSTWLAP